MMSPKRVYYKPSTSITYGPDQPTNGAALHQLRIRALDEHCQRLKYNDACCSAAEVLKMLRTYEFWSMPVTASKSNEKPKSTRSFQTAGIIECKGAYAQVAAVVRLTPDAQPGDVLSWFNKRLNLCSGCALHRVDIFRLDESETAAAAVIVTESAAAAASDTGTQPKVKKGAKKAEDYANQLRLWELHLRCLLDEPGAFAEQILLKDLSGSNGAQLLKNALSADMTFPHAADEDVRYQLAVNNVDAILDGHTRNVVRLEISAGLHPTLQLGSWLPEEKHLPPLTAVNIRAWGLAGMSASQYKRCIALGVRFDRALQLQRARISMILARLQEQGVGMHSDSDCDSVDAEGGTDSEFTADTSEIGADVLSSEAAAAAAAAAADDSMEPGDFDQSDDISFEDCMRICELLGQDRAAKRSRAELES
jgi:hypothetical protein